MVISFHMNLEKMVTQLFIVSRGVVILSYHYKWILTPLTDIDFLHPNSITNLDQNVAVKNHEVY